MRAPIHRGGAENAEETRRKQLRVSAFPPRTPCLRVENDGWLFYGDALREIAGLVDVAAAANGDVVRQQL